MYGVHFQSKLNSWRQYCAVAEKILLRTLDDEATCEELMEKYHQEKHDAIALVKAVRGRWAAAGRESAPDKRDAIRARLNQLWEVAMTRKRRDMFGKVLIDPETQEEELDPDIHTARAVLKDMRQLDALDMPMRVQIDANLTVNTTTTRERVMGLLAKARAAALSAGNPEEPDEHDQLAVDGTGHVPQPVKLRVLGVDENGNSVIDIPEKR